MRKHLTNATYGVLDYASYPVAMLLVAPVVLRRIGASEYGLWIMCASVISAGGILASGFCDAAMQRIARLRGEEKVGMAAVTVRTLLTINLTLGSLLAVLVWFTAPIAAKHVASYHVTSAKKCVYSLRMSGAWILLRGLESAGVITHRAFEEYRGSVQISIAARLLTLASAAVLATVGYRVPAILVATGVALTLGVFLQFRGLRNHFGPVSLRPAFDCEELRLVVRPGMCVAPVGMWCHLRSLDRILLAVSFGVAALAPYALCVQFAARSSVSRPQVFTFSFHSSPAKLPMPRERHFGTCLRSHSPAIYSWLGFPRTHCSRSEERRSVSGLAAQSRRSHCRSCQASSLARFSWDLVSLALTPCRPSVNFEQ